MTDDSEMVEVRRETLALLIESLEETWWIQAAHAVGELRLALINVTPKPKEPQTFGSG